MRPETTLVVPELLLLLELESELLVSVFEFVSAVGVDFLVVELVDCLKTCSNTSAPGPDHVTWRILKGIISDID